jgi:hypothetical protein
LKLDSQSQIRTKRSEKPVRLSGVFVDAAGSLKGLTVLGVLPGAVPTDGWSSSQMVVLPQAVLDVESAEQLGWLDRFWWQRPELIDSRAYASTSWSGGAMTCLFTLAESVTPADESWVKSNAKIAALEAFIKKPVRLATGGEIGVIEDELNNISLSDRLVYPLLKLRRLPADKSSNAGIRNGAMVFAEDGGMVGVIVATFGQGEFYSVAPIGDILHWHSLDFIETLTHEARDKGAASVASGGSRSIICGSEGVTKLLGGGG